MNAQSARQDDLNAIRLEQARLLRQNAVRSCITVEAVIVYLTLMIYAFGQQETALGWFLAASGMVLVSFLYSRYRVSGDLKRDNYQKYLRGHIVVCAITGTVWGLFASAQINGQEFLSLFVASNIIFAITVGGMLPGSEYRPGFVALATCAILPFSVFWFLRTDGPVQIAALGILLYYGFGLMVSAQTDRDIQDGITARQNQTLMEKLVERNAEIEKAQAERSRFLAATSHDLAQPLHAQGFFIDALRAQLTTPEQTALLDKIRASWQNQSDLLRGIVDITRIDSGSIVPKITNFDAAEIFRALVAEYEEQAANKSIELTTQISPAIVASDSVLVGRVLRNLLSNAIRYTPAGGRVDFVLSSDEDGPLCILSDNGPGIAPEHQPLIFDEYVRLADANRDDPGLGLGLSIVKRLTALLGLTLDLTSDTGKGTRWTLHLPPASDVVAHETHAERHDLIEGNPLIVIIDDMAEARQGMSAALTNWGCRTMDFATEKDALDLLGLIGQTPDILLVDRQLGDNVIGTDVITNMRKELSADIPAILLTGDIAVLKDTARASDFSVLMKPVQPADLKRALSDIMSPHTSPNA